MECKKTTLDNGVRVLTTEMPQMKSVASTVYIGAGSRYEQVKNNGISHFLEHMVFKGTKKYPQQADIAMAIEGIGGQLNAWTDQDHTAYWNLLPASHASVGFEVLSEMILNSMLDKDAIDRERGVIIEEINRRFDNPASHVFELLIGSMWPDHPLGWPVIGNKENIMAIQRQDFVDYMSRYYLAKNIVISVAGNIRHEDTLTNFKKLFENAKVADIPSMATVTTKQDEAKASVYYKKTDQAHLALGVRAFSNNDPDRFALNILNVILGLGMSSRLFLTIREEKGLAYSINSGIESYKDTGFLFVHAGLNIDKLNDAVSAIGEEFIKLRDIEVSEDELQRAKDYAIGSINLSMDDTDDVSSWFGRQELLLPKVYTHEEVMEKLRAVESNDIKRVAKRIFANKNLNLSVIAPIENNNLASLLKID